MDIKILSYLEEKKDFVSTLSIAKNVVGESAVQSDVNPILYSLLSRKKVIKMMDAKGRNPHWKFNDSPEVKVKQENELKIIDFLKNSSSGVEDGVDTSTISSAVGLAKKDINSVIYSLLKQGKVSKLDGKVPKWRLIV